MAMIQKIWSISAAATELQRAEKTVGRALKGVEPDGHVKGGFPGWFMNTIVTALANYERQPIRLGLSARRARGGTITGNGTSVPPDPALGQLQDLADQVASGLRRLRAAPENERLTILRDFGASVGALDKALQRSAQGPDATTALGPFRDALMSDVVTEIVALLNADHSPPV
jgi:hypothetical protein